jgi:hypothetical protein
MNHFSEKDWDWERMRPAKTEKPEKDRYHARLEESRRSQFAQYRN